MKKRNIALVCMALAALLLCGSALAEGAEGITATGKGVVYVEPDYVTVALGVSERAENVPDAQSTVNKSLDAVRKALAKTGVEDGDIKTGELSIYAMTDYSGEVERITGYSATHQLEIRVHDIDKAGAIIDDALNAGANQLNYVSFGIEDGSAAYAQALQLAVAAAQNKAQIMAQAAGVALGKLEAVTEETGYFDDTMAKFGADAEGIDEPTQLEKGTLTVTASVAMRYDIAD